MLHNGNLDHNVVDNQINKWALPTNIICLQGSIFKEKGGWSVEVK